MIVVVPIIAAVIAVTISTPAVRAATIIVAVITARSPANVFLDLLISLVSVCPLLRHREQVLD
jgi:hypothetical protein